MGDRRDLWRPKVLLECLCPVAVALAGIGCGDRATGPGSAAGNASDPTSIGQVAAIDGASPSGPELFARHCAACHGPDGDGLGRAARYLYPKPRNFQASRFRLVSSAGSIPSDEDLRAVIVRGMPGTAMPAHPHLDGSEVDELIREVLRIRRAAIRQRIIEIWREDSDEQEVDEGQIDAAVEQHFQVGKILDVPANDNSDAATIARGKELFASLACAACHGPEGRGDGVLYLTDDLGQRVLPRDLVFGRFKGGHAPASVYRRLALGMPGTPMPAQAGVSETDLIALVRYVGSLSREPKQELTNYQRSIRLLEH